MSQGVSNHGTVHLPSSGRYYLTASGVREAASVLDFDTPSDYVRAYPMSKEWFTLLIRRMDAVAAVYRLAATLSPGTDGLRTDVEFHRRGRFDATITRGIWSTELITDKEGRQRHVGHRIETWARQTKHADGITWFLSKLEAETREDPDSELQWSVPTARADRAYNWGQSAIAPDAVGHLIAGVSTCRSTSNTSFVPVTPGELLPACAHMSATTLQPSTGMTSRPSPSLCSSWTPRMSKRPT